MAGLDIDIVLRSYYFVLSVYKNVFESSQGGRRLNSQTPNKSTELSVNLVDSLSLNFLDCRAEICIHLYEEL